MGVFNDLITRLVIAVEVRAGSSNELSTSEAKELLDTLADWGIQLLIFDGGEPLCRDDFFEIAKYASHRRMRVVEVVCTLSEGTVELTNPSHLEQLFHLGEPSFPELLSTI